MSASVGESDTDAAESDSVAVVGSGRGELVREFAEFDDVMAGEREPVACRRKSLRRCYAALMRSEGSLGPDDLLPLYEPAGQALPGRGWYGRQQERRWWEDVGRSNLLRLPGVRDVDGERLRFVGIGPDEVDVDEEHVRPLEAFRSDPRVEAIDFLVNAHGPDTDAYEQVLRLWDSVARASETTTEELARDYRLSPEEYGEELARCPHIERVEETFDPGEVALDDVETLAELYEFEQAKVAETTVRWEFTGAGSGESHD